jgi:hypothetical protein
MTALGQNRSFRPYQPNVRFAPIAVIRVRVFLVPSEFLASQECNRSSPMGTFADGVIWRWGTLLNPNMAA